jgi:hypothetical protein
MEKLQRKAMYAAVIFMVDILRDCRKVFPTVIFFLLQARCLFYMHAYFFKYLIVVAPIVPLKANGAWSK